MSDQQPKIPAVGRFVYIAPTTLTSRHSGEVCVNAADYDTAIQRIAKLEADLDALVKSPAIPETLGNVQSVTASGARIAADAAFEADKLAHPPKKALTFWGAVEGTVLWIHRLEPPIF